MTSGKTTKSNHDSAPVALFRHDHSICVSDTLAAAEKWCRNKKLRLTPVRRKVLEVLLREHRALGAYAILDHLRDAGFGSQPIVAYRALEFLTAQGFAHKIERLSAFVACTHPGKSHAPAFMICRVCNVVAETKAGSTNSAIETAAQMAGFQIERTVVEAVGICSSCVETDPA